MRLPARVALLSLAGCGLGQPYAPRAVATSGPGAAMAGEVVVALRGEMAAESIRATLGSSPLRRLPALGLEVHRAAEPSAFAVKAARLPGVAWAELNRRIGLSLPDPAAERSVALPGFRITAEGDPMLGEQWALTRCRFPEAWSKARGGRHVPVAVVDTGADLRHEDLESKVVPGWDFIHQDPDPRDDHFHGTHCVGIVGAARGNGVGIAGGAPDTPVLVVKSLDWEGVGTYDQIAQGIVHAVDRGARIISLSLGSPQKSHTLSQAVSWAVAKGVLVVAAMGNENSDAPSYPAAYPGVLAVGSTRADDSRSGFSNRGGHMAVCAPGSKILSTDRYDKYQTLSGTSMAAPLVAALASMVWGLRPDWSAAEVKEQLRRTAVDLGEAGPDPSFGAGRIDALSAVESL